MQVLFRADASQWTGSGHIMRCLTLAERLAKAGANCFFFCTDYSGEMSQKIARHGFQCTLLPRPQGDIDEQQDAAWCQQRVARIQCSHFDWIVADHYGLGKVWHQAMRSLTDAIMVIDDLADRDYDADILLDQNWQRQASHYRGKTAPDCEILAGTRYALLRPEFTNARQRLAKTPAAKRDIRSILISFGGADPDNLSLAALCTLATLPWSAELQINIVLGAQFTVSSDLMAQAFEEYRKDFDALNIYWQTEQMAQLMLAADIAIGAAGTSLWERCCLGLPTLAVIYADNQRAAANALAQTGAIALWHNNNELIRLLQQLKDDKELYLRMLSKALTVCDGLGLERVAERLLSSSREQIGQ